MKSDRRTNEEANEFLVDKFIYLTENEMNDLRFHE